MTYFAQFILSSVLNCVLLELNNLYIGSVQGNMYYTVLCMFQSVLWGYSGKTVNNGAVHIVPSMTRVTE
jgi:hypothetical protein